MPLAEKFDRPLISFVDTPGAYPGLDAEERGSGEAIARNLRDMATLEVPIIVTVPEKEEAAARSPSPWGTA